jgi:NTP pyrophosphatase (non-canonical NTP hydrolase)
MSDKSLTLQELSAGVRETAITSGELKWDACHMAFGLAEEAGEVAGKLKRFCRGDPGAQPSDPQWLAAVSGELGDTLWYVAALADTLGLSLDQVAAQLLAKTRSRKARGVLTGSGDSR